MSASSVFMCHHPSKPTGMSHMFLAARTIPRPEEALHLSFYMLVVMKSLALQKEKKKVMRVMMGEPQKFKALKATTLQTPMR